MNDVGECLNELKDVRMVFVENCALIIMVVQLKNLFNVLTDIVVLMNQNALVRVTVLLINLSVVLIMNV